MRPQKNMEQFSLLSYHLVIASSTARRVSSLQCLILSLFWAKNCYVNKLVMCLMKGPRNLKCQTNNHLPRAPASCNHKQAL